MKRGIPIAAAALALATLSGDATAQQRPRTVWQRPNPQATRPMGVPASVQPSGRPRPGPPIGCWYRCGAPGIVPGYPYPAAVPYVYPTVYAWPGAFYPVAQPGHGAEGRVPNTRRPPVMTIVQPAAPPRGVEVRRLTPVPAEGCAVVEVRTSGELWRSRVPLPSLGADTPAGLFRALAVRLAGGRQVTLEDVNGTRLALPGGLDVSGLAVDPCDREGPPAGEPGA